MLRVTIRMLTEPHTEWVCTTRTDERDEAIARAVRRFWGRGHYWVPDSGLGWRYGQIGSGVPQRLGGGTNLSTARMRVTVEGARS